MEQTITIQPIINGSVNPRLTPKLFAELNHELQARVIWNLKVTGEFAHSFQDIDREVFIKIPTTDHEDHPDPVQNFIQIKDKLARHHNYMRVKTREHRFELGKKIFQAQRELGFGGQMELDADRLQGYIFAGGSWNDFDVKKVCSGIRKLEVEIPRVDYGVNNPNTGISMHKWKVTPGRDYVVLEFDFISTDTLAKIQKFFETEFTSMSKMMQADSCRIETEDLGNGYHSGELILWWD
jgi:hypothetical protein